jgi:hypothetical protein
VRKMSPKLHAKPACIPLSRATQMGSPANLSAEAKGGRKTNDELGN